MRKRLNKQILIVAALLLSVINFSFDKPNSKQVVKVVIRTIDMMFQANRSISCSELKEFDDVEVFELTDKKSITKVMNYIKVSDTDKSGIDYGIDARATVYLHYANNNCDSLCLTRATFFYYNSERRMFKSMDFIRYVDSLYHTRDIKDRR